MIDHKKTYSQSHQCKTRILPKRQWKSVVRRPASFLFVLLGLVFFFVGPGSFSLDNLIFKNESNRRYA